MREVYEWMEFLMNFFLFVCFAVALGVPLAALAIFIASLGG